MPKKRKIIPVILSALVAAGALAGCGGQNGDDMLTAKGFQTAMEEQGLTVIDQTDSAADDSYLSVMVAYGGDEDAEYIDTYQLEYYFMKSDDAAEYLYDYSVQNVSAIYENDGNASISESNGTFTSEVSIMRIILISG